MLLRLAGGLRFTCQRRPPMGLHDQVAAQGGRQRLPPADGLSRRPDPRYAADLTRCQQLHTQRCRANSAAPIPGPAAPTLRPLDAGCCHRHCLAMRATRSVMCGRSSAQ